MISSNITLKLKDIEFGRKNPNIYKVFCEKFIPCVMGKIRFRVNCYSKKLSDYCTVSDETMAVLVLRGHRASVAGAH